MDKERAKFVLQSFRPDGADSEDADFAEALKLATSDRELGEWLMRERAFDAEFAEALARVDLSEGLLESVLLAMAQDNGLSLRADKESEEEMINALSSVLVPEGLRERILVSMDRSAVVVRPNFGWAKVWVPAAAAAGIAGAIFLIDEKPEDEIVEGNTPREIITKREIVAVDSRVSFEAVQTSFLNTFESPSFDFDQKSQKSEELMGYLRKNGLPYGSGYLPKGLSDVNTIGCRQLTVDGKEGSLICLDEKEGMVHFIIFQKEDIQYESFVRDAPKFEQDGDWTRATWVEDEYAFCLMAVGEKDKLERFF